MRDDAYDDKDKIFKPQPGPQTAFIESQADIVIYGGSAGSGKATHLGCQVATPFGFRKMGDLKVGDVILNPNGNSQKITQVYGHEGLDFYKVTFNDGSDTIVCEDHLWVSWKASVVSKKTQVKRQKGYDRYKGLEENEHSLYPDSAYVIATKDIKKEWLDKGHNPLIPVCKPLNFTKSYRYKTSVDPYLLGLLIGDGCITEKALTDDRVQLASMDEYIIKYPESLGFKITYQKTESKALTLVFNKNEERDNLILDLKSSGLYGTYSDTKFIPDQYLYSSVDDREAILQGLMDTDGSVSVSITKKGFKHNTLEYGTVSPRLRDTFKQLVESLGGWVSFIKVESYDVQFNNCKQITTTKPFYRGYVKLPAGVKPFRLERKASQYIEPTRRLYRTITSIAFDHTGPGRCITVSNPNRLFMVNNFIVTHNSFAILLESLRNIQIPNFYAMILRRTSGEVKSAGSLWDESHTIYPHFEGESFISKLTWKFPSGSKTQFAFIEHEKDLERFKGAQVPLIMFDELTTFSERMFWYMFSRNRSTTGIPGYMRCTTNPEAGWVRNLISWWLDDAGYPIPLRSGVVRWFVRLEGEMFWGDSAEELIERFSTEEVMPKSLTFIPAKLSDNKKLLDKDPGYKGRLMAMSRVDRMKLLDGCWDVQATFGSYFERSWCELVMMPDEPCRWVRYWDRASSEPSETYPNPDYTAGVLMGVGKQTGSFYIKDVVRFRAKPMKVHAEIRKTAEKDKKLYGNVRVVIEKDPGQAGASDAHYLVNHLKGFEVRVRSATKDKLTRFLPFSAAAENGLIKVCRGEWNEAFLAELERFIGDGVGKDDQVDGASGGFNELLSKAYSAPNLVMPDLSFKGLGISSNVRF